MMNVKINKRIILSIAAVIIVMVVTWILFTNSGICDLCGDKFSGKYYVALDGSNYCKACGEEYYTGWAGDLDSVTRTVDNNMRNSLLVIDLLFFAIIVFLIKKQKIAIDEVGTSVKKKIDSAKAAVSSKIEPIIAKSENTTARPKGEKSKAEALREIKSLLDEGILSQEEFEAEKKRILGQ